MSLSLRLTLEAWSRYETVDEPRISITTLPLGLPTQYRLEQSSRSNGTTVPSGPRVRQVKCSGCIFATSYVRRGPRVLLLYRPAPTHVALTV